MKATRSSESASSLFRTLSVTLIAAAAVLTCACGSSSSIGSSGQTFHGNTNVTILATSTANDQLSQFWLNFNSITLTDKAGKVVTLLSSPQGAELIHLNGTSEPMVSTSIPQGIYVSGTATIGYAEFACVTLIPSTGNPPGGLLTAIYSYGSVPNANVTVKFDGPITITGNSMGLLFNMIVSQSATLASCYNLPGAINTYSITPTFSVTRVSSTGENGLNGQVASVNTATGNLTLKLADSQSISVNTAGNTLYEGIADISALAPGMLVTLDATFQPDGSHVASRIAVSDPNTTNISTLSGPIVQTNPYTPVGPGPSAWVLGPQQQGYFADTHQASIWMPYNLNSANFQISGALSNLGRLPFVPAFNSGNMVPGQNVYVTTESVNFGIPGYLPATTVTLVPQTVNGNVIAVSNNGAFQDYTVSLAPYNLLPALAVQQGQPVLLNNPNTIEVYVDNNTQRLNTQALAPGSTFRFNGLVFNDNGTLRMDCARVSDGVTGTLPTTSLLSLAPGQARTTYRDVAGHLQVKTLSSSSAR
jgi:hypothetical protein